MLFSYFLVPAFVGYWVLLSVNIREQKILCFDPQKRLGNIDRLVRPLMWFLKEEFSLSNGEHTPLSDIAVEIHEEPECFDEPDSGVYILKHTENACLGKSDVLTRELVQKYREHILQMLFIHGKKQGTN